MAKKNIGGGKCNASCSGKAVKNGPPVPRTGTVMGVVVTKSFPAKNLVDAVSGDWKIAKSRLTQANSMQYILAIENARVIAVFERVGLFTPLPSDPERYSVQVKQVTDPAVTSMYVGCYHHPYGAAVIFF